MVSSHVVSVTTGSGQTLVRLLRNRFGDLPAPVEKRIKAARDVAQLNEWFDRASTAATLADVGILP